MGDSTNKLRKIACGLGRDPIIAVDFDGTIVEHRFPEIGPVKNGAKTALQTLHGRGVKIIIWTCRSDEYLLEMVQWLIEQDIPFDAVNMNIPGLDFETGQKIYADIYIDDRSLTGLPDWEDIQDMLILDKTS